MNQAFSVKGETEPLPDDALDVNKDVFVNIFDVQIVVGAILGEDTGEMITDVDASGGTDLFDLTAVVQGVLGGLEEWTADWHR